VIKLRNNFTRLAEELLKENKRDSAIQVLDRIMELAPASKVPYDLFVPPIAEDYYNCGQAEKAKAIVKEHLASLTEELVYYYSLDQKLRQNLDYETRVALQLTQEYVQITDKAGDTEMKQQAEELFTVYYQRYLQSNPQPQR
jgi:predicted Zn-dependent protease